MENFDGFLGSFSTAVLGIGLEVEGTLGVIVSALPSQVGTHELTVSKNGSEDIGSVAAGILRVSSSLSFVFCKNT
jgi:hypothetical protein